MEKLEKLLNYIIKSMVKTPEEVVITKEVKEDLIVFQIRVADGELGKIIGKNGATANSIRGVVQTAAVKDKLNVNIEFLD